MSSDSDIEFLYPLDNIEDKGKKNDLNGISVSMIDNHRSQIAEYEKQLTLIKRENNELKRENEDIKAKFDIAHQKIDDLIKKRDLLEQNNAQALKSERIQHQQDLLREKENYNKATAAAEKQVQQYKKSALDERKKTNELQTLINAFISFANNEYKTNFSTLNDISEHISQEIMIRDTRNPTSEINESNEEKLSEMIIKYRRLKKDFKQSLVERDALYQSLEVARSQSAVADDFSRQIESLQPIVEGLETENNRLKGDYETKQKELESMKSELTTEINNLRAQSESESSNYRKSIDDLEQRLKKSTEEKERLARALTKRTDKLENVKSDLSLLDDRVSELEEANNILVEENDGLHSENKKLFDKLRKMQKQIDEFQSNLDSAKNDLALSKKELIRVSDEKGDVESSLKAARDQLYNITQEKKRVEDAAANISMEKARVQAIADRLKTEMNKAESKHYSEIQELKATLSQAQMEASSLRESAQKRPPIDPIVWTCDLFPAELNSLLDKVDRTQTAQSTAAKASVMLDAIAHFFNARGVDNSTDIISQDGDYPSLFEDLFEFAKDISGYEGDFDEVRGDEQMQRELMDRCSLYVDAASKAKAKSQKYDQLCGALLRTIGTVAPTEIEQKLGEMKDTNAQLSGSLKQASSETKVLSKQLAETNGRINILSNEKSELESKLKDVQHSSDTSMQAAKRQLDSATADNAKLKSELENLKKDYKELKDTTSAHIQKTADAHTDEIQQLRQKHAEELTEKDNTIAALASKLEAVRSKAKASGADSRAETDRIKMEFESALEEQRKQDETNRMEAHRKLKELKNYIESVVPALRKQLDASKGETDSALDKLRAAEQQWKDAKRQLARADEEKQRLQAEIAGAKERARKEVKLAALKLKTDSMVSDSRHAAEIDELKSEFESEKRRIFGFIAAQFMFFFDARSQLDDGSFKQVIKAAKDELERLQNQESSIRGLLGVASDESIEKAIISLMNRK